METLKELYPQEEKNTEIAIFGLDELIKAYRTFKDLEKDYAEKAKEMQAKICAKMGENESAVDDVYGCTWKTQSKTSVDTKALKARYPEIYEELAKVSSYRVFRTRNI